MIVGLFVGMAVVVTMLFTVTYMEMARIWKDLDSMRREIRKLKNNR